MSELIKNLKLHEGFRFQSPRSGQICSNLAAARKSAQETAEKFQSPRSGQICSNHTWTLDAKDYPLCFNPLDRVKFVQIHHLWR